MLDGSNLIEIYAKIGRKRSFKRRREGILIFWCVCALSHLPVVTNVEWILNNKTDITVRLCTTEHLVFLFGAHFVSCRFIFVSCCFTVCRRIVLLPISLELYIVVTVFFLLCLCVYSVFWCAYFNFFPAFLLLLFYGWFAGVFVLACGSVSSIQYDIILFFFELCKLVSQHDTTQRCAAMPSNVEILFNLHCVYCVSISLFLSLSLCMLNLLFLLFWWVK